MELLAKLFRIFGKRCDVFLDRLPLSTLDFCDQCNFEPNNSAAVENFRRAFAAVVSADPTLVYPQDEAAIFGLNRSDDLATFLFNQGLLRNNQYRYDFPMEDASSVGNIIKVSINLNQQAEQGEAQVTLGPEWDSALITRLHGVIKSHAGSIRESSWGLDGSQEVCTYAIKLAGGHLTANAETYMGLTLRGPAHLVQRIESAMESDSKVNANTQK